MTKVDEEFTFASFLNRSKSHGTENLSFGLKGPINL